MVPARPSFALAAAALLSACGGAGVDLTPTDNAGPTWHQDVAPIVGERCAGCHAPGAIAGTIPFQTYAQAAPWASLMAAATAERRMPPFPADVTPECPNPWAWLDDRRLADEQIAVFAAWSAAGAPEGDPASASPVRDPLEPPGLDHADLSLSPQTEFTVPSRDEAADTFACFVVDPGLTEDAWVEGVDVLPDATSVVHHVVVYSDPLAASDALADDTGWYACTGSGSGVEGADMIGGWIPGAAPMRTPAGTAIRVPAGGRIIVEMHYHGSDAPVVDATRVALQLASGPRTEAVIELFGNAGTAADGLEPGPNDPGGVPTFLVPAGVAGHTETMRVAVEAEPGETYGVFLAANHMHRIGTRMRAWVEPADGSPDTCLLDTPRWSFDWQLLYGYDVAAGIGPVVRDGDTLVLECTYDNSLDNPGVRIALAEQGLTEPVDVRLGEGTLDEMCIFVGGAVPL